MNDEAKALSKADAAKSADTSAKAVPSPADRTPRTSARVAAVQALFQMDLAGTPARDVIDQFKRSRFDADDADIDSVNVDIDYFDALVEGVVRRQRDIDPMIAGRLADGWRLGRLDRTLRAILRAAVFEIVERNDVPVPVTINEYINIAHAFFDGDEPKVVNGVLDGLSRDHSRSKDLSPQSSTGDGND